MVPSSSDVAAAGFRDTVPDVEVLEATGLVLGLTVPLPEALVLGPVRLCEQDSQVHFQVTVDVTGLDTAARGAMALRVPPAVQAALVVLLGRTTEVRLGKWDYPGRGTAVTATATATVLVLAPPPPHTLDATAAARTLQVLLEGSDERLAVLYEVFRLGVQAQQLVAPEGGVWAFCYLIEEAGGSNRSMEHVPKMVRALRDSGYQLPPDPTRNVARLRTSAAHSTLKDPLPDAAEVNYLRQLALAYLLWRADTRKYRCP